ncbi:MAG: 50S ribosomal protein L31e [archaeon]
MIEKESDTKAKVEEKEIVEKKDSDKNVEKKKSLPAVAKETKKISKKDNEKVSELKREYIIPLKRGVLKAPQYRRAKKAIRIIREFIVRHMKVRDRDLKKVKIDRYLNNEIWFRGIKKPANKIKVIATTKGDFVYVELAEIHEAVKFAMEKDKKKKAKTVLKKGKKVKEIEDKDKDGVDDKTEEKEDMKAGAELDEKILKSEATKIKHTTPGEHKQKTAPVRKTLR